MAGNTPIPTKEPIGVRGWLWGLSLYLVIGFPILNLLNMVPEASELVLNWDRLPTTLVVAGVVNLLLFLALSLFSVHCGVAIKNVRANAVQLTKAFLLAVVVWAFIFGLFLLAYFNDAPSEVRDAIRQEAGSTVIGWIILSLAVYVYLAKSSRVRATFATS